jgi:hypothetical protein
MKPLRLGALAALAGLGLCSGCASPNPCSPGLFGHPPLFPRAPVTDCCPTCGPGAPGAVPLADGPLLGEPGPGLIGTPTVLVPGGMGDLGTGAPIYTQPVPPAAPDRLLPVPVPQPQPLPGGPPATAPLPAVPGAPPAAPAPAAPSSRWRGT